MSEESTLTPQDGQKTKVIVNKGSSGSVYGIGMVGAWMYFFKHATTTEERIKAFFKGLAWPAILVYELLVFLKKD